MSNETEFVNGLIFKAPNDNAPEYVKAKGSIKVADLIAWLQSRDGEWVNFDLKVSQGGKWYAAVDNWKPQGRGDAPARSPQRGGGPARKQPSTGPTGGDDPFPDDDIPF